jgi:hypothetical protein
MDETLKKTLFNRLKCEAKYILNSKEDIRIKCEKMNVIFNLQKVLDNYDELEPLLTKFFAEKAKREKWRGD